MNQRGDRSIRNIPVPAGHRRMRNLEEEYQEEAEGAPRRRRRINIRNPFIWITAVVVVLCAAVGVLLATVFAGATINISPRSAAVTPPSAITASPNAPVGSLSYQIITTTRVASTSVAANGTQHVSRAATGVLTVYNEYSAQSQRLIANTRFQAPDGKIYRIHDSIVVPGETKNPDGSVSPGTMTASAFADSPGDTYNRGATQFTIPGFQGDPRYTKVYAKTDQMSGGFIGDEPAVSPADRTNAENVLKQGLEGALRDAVATQIPKEFLPIPGTLTIAYSDVSQTPNGEGKATLSQSATASAGVIKVGDLAAAIAAQTVQGYAGEAVGFKDPSQISVALASSSAPVTGPLQLRLSGSPTLVWVFDPNALKQALLGKSKNDFEKIIQSFAPAIECTQDTPCKASVRPFWSSTFPTNSDKITIVTGQ